MSIWYNHFVAGKKREPTTAHYYLVVILTTIGKPFYFILSHIFIAIYFIFYTIWNLAKKIKLPKFPTFPKPKIHKVIYPQFKFPIKRRYLFSVLGLITFYFISYYLVFRNLPSPKELVTREQEVSTKIYDRNDNLLYTIYKDKNRTPVKLAQIPENVKLATLAAEDAEFYNHIGFSTRGTIRAISKNITEGKLQGGTTITQQLVKNALLSSEKIPLLE